MGVPRARCARGHWVRHTLLMRLLGLRWTILWVWVILRAKHLLLLLLLLLLL